MEKLAIFTMGLVMGGYLIDWIKNHEIKQLEKENENLSKQLRDAESDSPHRK